MYCPNCGNKLPEDARFCPECGKPISMQPATHTNPAQRPAPAQPSSASQPNHEEQTYQMPPAVETPYVPGSQRASYQGPVPPAQNRSNNGLVVGVIIAVIVLMLITAVATVSCAALSIGGSMGITPSIGSSVHTMHDVTFVTNDFGDYDQNSSRIPVQITGTDVDGNKVDKTIFLAHSGVDTQLAEGTYEARVLGSPIASNGTIYDYPSRAIKFKISNLAPNEAYVLPSSKSFKFSAIDPEDMTDEKVNDALSWARKDEESGVDVGKLEEAIKKRRESAKSPKNEEAKPEGEGEATPEDSAEQQEQPEQPTEE